MAPLLVLKRVEIQGFKSFCDRTEMRFPGRGVAAVVGPNGCGKSNLSDAISWVLGEQSARACAGRAWKTFIFAGTCDRKPLGMAQVSMVLVDPNGLITLPSAKVEALKQARAAASEASSETQVEVLEAARSNERPQQRQRPRERLDPAIARQRAGDHDHAAAFPVRRERVSDQRQAGAFARHPGPFHGHGPGAGIVRDYRAGASGRFSAPSRWTAAR